MCACIDSKVASMMSKVGYMNLSKITSSLQGSIWRASKQLYIGSNEAIFDVVAKITNIYLHSKSMMIVNDKQYKVNENILSEIAILQYHLRHIQLRPNP